MVPLLFHGFQGWLALVQWVDHPVHLAYNAAAQQKRGIMLYTWYDTARQMLMPWMFGAHAWQQALTAPHSWMAQWPLAEATAAGFEVFERLVKEYDKPAFGIHEVEHNGHMCPVVEREVLRTPFCRLVRFKRYADTTQQVADFKDDPVVLVVAPLSGHHATLLRDTVRTLLQDHKVYVTDWVNARDIPLAAGPFGLADYVRTIEMFVRHIGPARTHILAVCQPVVPVLGAVALMSARKEAVPASMILMGGPVDARQSPTAVNNLATHQSYDWFDKNVIHEVPHGYAGQGRKVYPGFLQHLGFVAMNPERHMKAHWDFYENLLRGDGEDAQTHRAFYDEYNAVLDMPAEYYLDTIATVFQNFSLAEGTWDVFGERVQPQLITQTALMTIEGARDDIAGQGQTQAAHALCRSLQDKQRTHFLADTGHYGLFSGRKWRTDIYPKVRDFIAQHNDLQ